MSTAFFVSDLHLGHKNIPKYREKYGKQFETLDSHDEYIIQRIVETVNKRDVLYILGDCCFSKDKLYLLDEIPCAKYLVLGNHCTENLSISDLLPYFKEITGMKKHKSGMWLTHAPIHPEELRGRFNIHGHIHGSKLVKDSWKYFNVSLENIDFKPISLEEIRENIWNQFILDSKPILDNTNMLLEDILRNQGFKPHKVNKMLNKKLNVGNANE